MFQLVFYISFEGQGVFIQLSPFVKWFLALHLLEDALRKRRLVQFMLLPNFPNFQVQFCLLMIIPYLN